MGPIRNRGFADLVERYAERAARLSPLETRVVRASRASELKRRQREDMDALKAAAEGGDAVLLTERGQEWSSTELARFLAGRLTHSGRPTVFLMGGEDGFDPADEGWAAQRLALSRMTLPHELARVVLAEQVYRALTLVRNVRYHR